MKIIVRYILTSILCLCSNLSFGQSTYNITYYTPEELIGKDFVFAINTDSYTSNCFYNSEGIDKKKFDKKHLYKADINGETNRSEFIDRKFTVNRIIYKKGNDASKGFVLELMRDDNERLGLAFRAFKSKKRFKVENPTFSDLYIASSSYEDYESFKAFLHIVSSSSDLSLTRWKSFVKIGVYDVRLLQATINLEIPQVHQEPLFVHSEEKADKYVVDSMTIKSNGVNIFVTKNEHTKQILTPNSLSKIQQNLENIQTLHDSILACHHKYNGEDIQGFKLLRGKSLWALGGIFKDDITYINEDNKWLSAHGDCQIYHKSGTYSV